MGLVITGDPWLIFLPLIELSVSNRLTDHLHRSRTSFPLATVLQECREPDFFDESGEDFFEEGGFRRDVCFFVGPFPRLRRLSGLLPLGRVRQRSS